MRAVFLFKLLPLWLLLLLGDAGPMAMAAPAEPPKARMVMFIAHADVPPYYLPEPEPLGSGILVDVLKAVAEPLGLSFKTERLPDKRGWDMLEHGGVDVYATAREWTDDPDRFLWTDAFMPNEDVLLYRVASRLKYTRPEDLYGRTVAGIKGFVYPALEGHFGPDRITRLDAPSPDAMLRLLLLDRAEAALVNRTEILWMFRNRKDLDASRFRMDETPVGLAHFRFVFPKGRGWEPIIEQFNRRLETMKQDGSLKALLDRYR